MEFNQNHEASQRKERGGCDFFEDGDREGEDADQAQEVQTPVVAISRLVFVNQPVAAFVGDLVLFGFSSSARAIGSLFSQSMQ